MANIITDNKHYTDIANAIRDKAQTTDTYKPEEMAEAIANLPTTEAFWDLYQQNGNRLDYSYAFAGHGWTDETFKPKYDIKPRAIVYLFSATQITDLCKLLDEAGVVIDLSNTTSISYFAQSTNLLQTIPTLNVQNVKSLSYFISGNNALRSIEKVILNAEGTQTFSNYSFNGNPLLEEIRFEGKIGNSIAFKESPLLSVASLQSIIDALKDVSGGAQQTLTLHADAKARLTDDMRATISAKNWILG